MSTYVGATTAWARVSFVREIWVSPDGSGRIIETEAPLSFPSAGEHEEWVALGSPTAAPVSGSFKAGQLTYVSLENVSRDPEQLLDKFLRAPTKTELLREVALLLYENVPPVDLTLAIVTALREVPGVDVTDEGERVRIVATDGAPDSRLRTTMVINLTTGQLVSESRVALSNVVGLSADPPIIMLERFVDASELIAQ